jgi:hypothetical protein
LKIAGEFSIVEGTSLPNYVSYEEETLPGTNGMDTRRSCRVALRVPVRIYEPGTDKRFIIEEAYSVKVSLWGGQISLESAVRDGQKLLLVNVATGESQESHITHLGPPHLGRRLAGIEFLAPSPRFWGLTFPPVVSRRSPAKSAEAPAPRRFYA